MEKKTSKRARCKDANWVPTMGLGRRLKDPDLTTGKFYDVIDDNIPVMGMDSRCKVIGDNGEEITRPKHIFTFFV